MAILPFLLVVLAVAFYFTTAEERLRIIRAVPPLFRRASHAAAQRVPKRDAFDDALGLAASRFRIVDHANVRHELAFLLLTSSPALRGSGEKHRKGFRVQEPAYTTDLGRAYHADALDILRELPRDSVALVMTSPPFALRRRKA